MAVVTHIYWNGGSGGAVDYTTPVATVTGTTWTTTLAAGSDATFAVRQYDTVAALEEKNVDARARVVSGAAGQDLSGLPRDVSALAAYPSQAGSVVASWRFPNRVMKAVGGAGLVDLTGRGPLPTGFRVYAGVHPLTYTAPLATVPFVPNQDAYSAVLTGLTPGLAVDVAVTVYNGAGERPVGSVVKSAASSGPPAVPTSVAAVAVP